MSDELDKLIKEIEESESDQADQAISIARLGEFAESDDAMQCLSGLVSRRHSLHPFSIVGTLTALFVVAQKNPKPALSLLCRLARIVREPMAKRVLNEGVASLGQDPGVKETQEYQELLKASEDIRPAAFIGSAAEGLDIAKAIQVNLDNPIEVKIWNQGLLGPGKGTLESLVNIAGDFDCAILVITPDDVVESRGERVKAPRDNVLFELGLFIGKIGRERTFVVCDRGTKMKLPSDLAGVTVLTFHGHADGNLQASVGAACTQIENRMRQLGIRER